MYNKFEKTVLCREGRIVAACIEPVDSIFVAMRDILDQVCAAGRKKQRDRVSILLDHRFNVTNTKSLDHGLLRNSQRAREILDVGLDPMNPQGCRQDQVLQAILRSPDAYELPWEAIQRAFRLVSRTNDRYLVRSCITDIQSFLQSRVEDWKGSQRDYGGTNAEALPSGSNHEDGRACTLSGISPKVFLEKLVHNISKEILSSADIVLGDYWSTSLDIVTSVISLISQVDIKFHRRLIRHYCTLIPLPSRLLAWLSSVKELRAFLEHDDLKHVQDTLLRFLDDEQKTMSLSDLPGIATNILSLARSEDGNHADYSWAQVLLSLLKKASTDLQVYSTVESVLGTQLSSSPSDCLLFWISSLMENQEAVPVHILANLLLLVSVSSVRSGSQLVFEVLSQSLGRDEKFQVGPASRKAILNLVASMWKESGEIHFTDFEYQYLGSGRFHGVENLTGVGSFVFRCIFLDHKTGPPDIYSLLERAQAWIEFARAILQEGGYECDVSWNVFPVVVFTVIFCEIPLTRPSILRTLFEDLAGAHEEFHGSNLDGTWCKVIESIFTYVPASNLSKKELNVVTGCLRNDNISSRTFDRVTWVLRNSLEIRDYLSSLTREILSGSFQMSISQVGKPSHRDHLIERALLGLSTLVASDREDKYFRDAVTLASNFIVLSKPILPLRWRSFLFDTLLHHCRASYFIPRALDILFQSILARICTFLETTPRAGLRLRVGSSFVVWSSKSDNRNHYRQTEDLVGIFALLLCIFDTMTSNLSEGDRRIVLQFRNSCAAATQDMQSEDQSDSDAAAGLTGVSCFQSLSPFLSVIISVLQDGGIVGLSRSRFLMHYNVSPISVSRQVTQFTKNICRDANLDPPVWVVPGYIRPYSPDSESKSFISGEVREKLQRELFDLTMMWLSVSGESPWEFFSKICEAKRNKNGTDPKVPHVVNCPRYVLGYFDPILGSMNENLTQALVGDYSVDHIGTFFCGMVDMCSFIKSCCGISTTERPDVTEKVFITLMRTHDILSDEDTFEILKSKLVVRDNPKKLLGKDIDTLESFEDLFRDIRFTPVECLVSLVDIWKQKRQSNPVANIARFVAPVVSHIRKAMEGSCGGLTEDKLILGLTLVAEMIDISREAHGNHEHPPCILRASKELVDCLCKYPVHSPVAFKSILMIALSGLPRLSLSFIRKGSAIEFGDEIRAVSWHGTVVSQIFDQCLKILSSKHSRNCESDRNLDLSSFLHLHSESAWVWALVCLLNSVENNWIECQDNASNGETSLTGTPYLELRRLMLQSDLLFLSRVLSSRIMGSDDFFTSILPTNLKITLARSIDRVIIVLNVSLRSLARYLHPVTHGKRNSVDTKDIAENIASVAAWVTTPTENIDIVNGVRVWSETAMKREDDVPIRSEDSLNRKFGKLVLRVNELEENLGKLVKIDQKENRVGEDLYSARREAFLETTSVGGLQGDLLNLVKTKYTSIKKERLETLGDKVEIEHIAKKQKLASEVEPKIRKQKRIPSLRSRNRVVDEWLQKDANVENVNEDDAYVDLEDFIVEG